MKSKLIAPISALALLLANSSLATVKVQNRVNDAISITVTHSAWGFYITQYTNVTETKTYTVPANTDLEICNNYTYWQMEHSVSSFSISGYQITGRTNGTLEFFAGTDPITFGTDGYRWTYTPTLSCTWQDPDYRTITITAISPPTPQSGNTRADNRKTGDCSGRPSGPGMAGYAFHSLLASLNIEDTPIAYQPPVGSPVAFTLTYNQKEEFQPDTWPYFNLGEKWTMSCVSFIQDDPASPTNDVRYFPPGGGSELFTGYNTNTGVYAIAPYSQSILVKTSTSSYELRFNDGSKQVFSFTAGSSPRRVFLSQAVDAAGNATTFNYETVASGTRLKQIVDAISQTNTLAYTNASDPLKVTSFTDPFGRSANMAYATTNGALRLVSITDPVNITSSFTYGPSNFINALTTPYGTTTFVYSETNGVKTLTATDPLGATECLQYRDKATLTADTAFPSGTLLDTNKLSERNTYFWNKKAWASGANDLPKAQIIHWGGDQGQIMDIPLFARDPLEGAVWFNYPGQTNVWGGNLASAQPSTIARVLDDGTTQSTTLSYDGWGNVTNAVDAIGRSTRFVYATNGIDLLQVQQKNGASFDALASVTYNSQHLPLVSIIAGITNKFGYSATGLLLKSTNGLNQVTTLNYNAKGYLTNIVGHLPTDTLDIRYDAAGRVYSLTASDGFSFTNQYDNLDRLTNTALPDGTTIQQIFDKLDVAKVRGRDNRWSYFTHNATRKLTDTQGPSGRTTHYEWCNCGALESITDGKGQMTTWMRDAQSRPYQKIYADLSLETVTYETRTSRVKQSSDPGNRINAIAYNADDTLKTLSFSGAGIGTPGVTNTYDTNYSWLTQTIDGTGTSIFGYVPAGQPAAGSLQTIDGPLANDTITYSYDELGRVKAVQVGSATSSAGYDELGRVKAVTNALGVTTIAYVGATSRPAVITRANGFGTVFGYTPVSNGSLQQSMVTTNAAGTAIATLGYRYNNRDLIEWQTNILGGVTTLWNYDYDLAGQLTHATQRTNGVVAHRYSYAYDMAGNRTSEQIDSAAATETANVINQLTSRTGGGQVRVAGYLSETGTVTIAGAPARMTTATNFEGEVIVGVGTYSIPVTATDVSGNAGSVTNTRTFTANGLSTTLAYDLSGNQTLKSNATSVLTFGWDGANRCVAITNGIYRTALVYEGASRWTRITEYSNSVVIADRRFIWNGVTLAEERDANNNVVQRFFSDGFQRGGTNYFYVKDHLGSVREVYSQSGVLQARFDYDPYGNKTQTYGTLKVDFGFAGLFELSNGIKLAVWRIYDPATGRWGSKDPIREQGGLNLYAYCGGDPVNGKDPTGLYTMESVMRLVLASPEGREYMGIAVTAGYSIQVYSTLNNGVNGWTSLNSPLIVLANSKDGREATDEEGATWLIHELRHAWQKKTHFANGNTDCMERDAYTFTEKWSQPRGYPAYRPEYRHSVLRGYLFFFSVWRKESDWKFIDSDLNARFPNCMNTPLDKLPSNIPPPYSGLAPVQTFNDLKQFLP